VRLAGHLRARGAQARAAPIGFVMVLAIATEAPDVANCSSAVPCAARRELADRAQKMCPRASRKGSRRQARQRTTQQRFQRARPGTGAHLLLHWSTRQHC